VTLIKATQPSKLIALRKRVSKLSAIQQWSYISFSAGVGLLFKVVGMFIWPNIVDPWLLTGLSALCIVVGLHLLRLQ